MTPEQFIRVFGGGHSYERLIIPATLHHIERWEEFSPTPYKDGKWPNGAARYSIGFGHSEGGDIEPKLIPRSMTFTIEQAREILNLDVSMKLRYINTRLPDTPLTQYMLGALVSLVYQYGQGRVDAANSVIPLLKNRDYIKAGVAMLSLNTKKDGTVLDGLTLRRASEVGLYMERIP